MPRRKGTKASALKAIVRYVSVEESFFPSTELFIPHSPAPNTQNLAWVIKLAKDDFIARNISASQSLRIFNYTMTKFHKTQFLQLKFNIKLKVTKIRQS